jgi:hypothetical protein
VLPDVGTLKTVVRTLLGTCVPQEKIQGRHENAMKVTVKLIEAERKSLQEKVVVGPPQETERANGGKIWAVFGRWARVIDKSD